MGPAALPCLWADRFGLDHCPAIEDQWCCLVERTLWGEEFYYGTGDQRDPF